MTLPPLPELDTWSKGVMVRTDVMHQRMREYGKQCREDLKADLAQALCSDCENGVKWLNEQAIKRFQQDFPSLYGLLK